ncbi:hypothetical protein [Natronosalvus vescus]|uniref:hypothetical protein n=1 Tax=Natronosalvus vescus TaxID=2953881 RepID=UPI002090166E|nr:hypothetical protein [Natronosalvus vescus]
MIHQNKNLTEQDVVAAVRKHGSEQVLSHVKDAKRHKIDPEVVRFVVEDTVSIWSKLQLEVPYHTTDPTFIEILSHISLDMAEDRLNSLFTDTAQITVLERLNESATIAIGERDGHVGEFLDDCYLVSQSLLVEAHTEMASQWGIDVCLYDGLVFSVPIEELERVENAKYNVPSL